MSRKNFTVATTEDGKTTLTKIDKTPTGKVKTMKNKEELQKAREEQYKNFRINALKRRAKRMGLTDEQTAVKIKELEKQMASTNDYDILIMYNPNDFNLVKQALLNDNIAWKMLVSSYGFIEGDDELLADLRKLLPPSAKIYPHVKRKPPILPSTGISNKKPKKFHNTVGNKSNTPKAIRNAKKAAIVAAMYEEIKKRKEANPKYTVTTVKLRTMYNVLKNDHKLASAVQKNIRSKKIRAAEKAKALFHKRCQKAQKVKSGTTIQMKAKKPSVSPKKASTSLKQAA